MTLLLVRAELPVAHRQLETQRERRYRTRSGLSPIPGSMSRRKHQYNDCEVSLFEVFAAVLPAGSQKPRRYQQQ
jgi:hypothetical protein